MEEQQNNENKPYDPFKNDPYGDAKQMKSAQTLITIGMIAGPVSIVFGGVFLSTIALICAILALTKINATMNRGSDFNKDLAAALRKQAIFAMAISGIALILNAVTLAMIMPAIFAYLETGDYQQLLDALNITTPSISSSSSSGSSVWG